MGLAQIANELAPFTEVLLVLPAFLPGWPTLPLL